MIFQPLTYAGQYPPLVPRSPSDVASYELIHSSLRTLPEMAREGDKILNEEMLARLVDGIRRFQRDHLGRRSKQYWPTVRLPDVLFHDRSSYPNGPLAMAILSAFRFKQTSPWRNFNFDNPKLFDDNVAIIKKIEGDLRDRGFLKRKVLYFDVSVEEGLGRAEVTRLVGIARRFGATVVDDVIDVAAGRATHVIAFDPEEHDAKEVIEEEERRERDGEEMEKTYLKTLALVDMSVDDDEVEYNEDGIVVVGGDTSINRKKRMALVHWWYHPSSYDEWMAAEDVSGEVEAEFHPGIPGGPAVVGCKFVRDVERFNEWGVEADYAVMEYERKIAYLRKETSKSSTSQFSTFKKSTKKRKRESMLEHFQSISAKGEGQSAIKRKKLQKEVNDAESPATMLSSEMISSPYMTLPVKRAKVAKGPCSSSSSQSLRQTSDRRRPEKREMNGGGGGMNPRRILTGIRGTRGEVVRRTVYDGALRVEEEPHKIVREAFFDYLQGCGSTSGGNDTKQQNMVLPTLNARPEWRKLLPPTGFIRPSVDASLKCMAVTELALLEEAKPSEEMNAVGTVVAVHRSIPILMPEVVRDEAGAGNMETGAFASCGDEEEPLSMRGGGLKDGMPGIAQQEKVSEHVSNVATSDLKGEGDGVVEEVAMWPPPAGTEEGNLTPVDDVAGDGETVEMAASEDLATANPPEHVSHAESTEDAMEVHRMLSHPVAEIANEAAKESLSKAPMADEGTVTNISKVSGDTPLLDSNVTVLDLLAAGVGGENRAGTDEKTCEPTALQNLVPNSDNGPNASVVASKPTGDVTTAATVVATIQTKVPASRGPTVLNDAIKPTSLEAAAMMSVRSTDATTEVTVNVLPNNMAAKTTATLESLPNKKQEPVICEVVSLPSGTLPLPSLNRPLVTNTTAEGDNKNQTGVRPSWYDPSRPSDFERRLLPEWFDGGAPHRNEVMYVATREKILDLAKENGHQYITSTAVRRNVVGDAGSLLRLHKFLTDYGLLNVSQAGEGAPSDVVLRGLGMARRERRSHSQMFGIHNWPRSRLQALEASVIKHVNNNNETNMFVDWDAVASDIGEGVTAADCKRSFIQRPLRGDQSSAGTDACSDSSPLISHMLNGVHPEVLTATVEASLQSAQTITESRKACFVGTTMGAAVQQGACAEAEIESILMDIIDQRVRRLENRVAMLDDVEALLEAERVSLELERRDMYTMRCRHWFGDGSS